MFEECSPVRFHKDNRRFYLAASKGANADLLRLVSFDAETGAEKTIESDPARRVDLSDVIFSQVSNELVATVYNDERIRAYWRNKDFEADYKLLQKRFPNRHVSFGCSSRYTYLWQVNSGCSSKDEKLWLVNIYGDTEPGETYLFDRRTKELKLQYKVRERLPREHLAEMRAIRYKSSDGLEIPAYLTLPKGVQPKNLPLLVSPHGGPQYRNSWEYDSYAQFWANRGYAVLQPNFRGSTGYGKRFVDAGNLQWGEKMQDDLTWGVKHLIAQGIADPKRVGIVGSSYGGYATLAGITFTPDLYAAAVAIVAPSNLITMFETIPPYWEVFSSLTGRVSAIQIQRKAERSLSASRWSILSSASKRR